MNMTNDKDMLDSIAIEEVRDRTLNAAYTLIETPMTLDELSDELGIDARVVYNDLHYRLPHLNKNLWREVQAILSEGLTGAEYMERRFKAQFDAVLKAREESGRDVNPGHKL